MEIAKVSLDELVNELSSVSSRMKTEGLVVFFKDTSPSSGYKYGFTFDFIIRTQETVISPDVPEKLKIQKCRDALALARAYLGDERALLPENFIPPALAQPANSEPDKADMVNLLRNDVRIVLESLNANAQYFLQRHPALNKGYHYAKNFGQLQSSIEFSMDDISSRRPTIGGMVSALSIAFNYAFVVAGREPLLSNAGDCSVRQNVAKLFTGYTLVTGLLKQGYEVEGDVGYYFKSIEPVIAEVVAAT